MEKASGGSGVRVWGLRFKVEGFQGLSFWV